MFPTRTVTRTVPFRADSPMNRAQNRGHLNRFGHTLTGLYVYLDDDDLATLIRTCCGETIATKFPLEG